MRSNYAETGSSAWPPNCWRIADRSWSAYSASPREVKRSYSAADRTGVLWAVWHLPVYFVGDEHWSDLVLVVVATVFFTWLFQGAGQSLLVAMVFHALNNSVWGEYFSQIFDGDGSTRQSWMLVVVWSVAAALVVFFGRAFRKARS